jgi:HEAT repeat protein
MPFGRTRTGLAVALGLALVLAAAAPARAHGGSYKPPPEDPPPDPPPADPPPDPSEKKPGEEPRTPDPTPPPDPGEKIPTPPPGGGRDPTPTPPGTPPDGTPDPRGKGGKRSRGASLEDWTAWWYFTRDRFLDRPVLAVTTSPSLGESGGVEAGPDDGALERAWRSKGLDALRRAFPDADVEVFTGCAVALGKAGGAADVPALLRSLGQRYSDASIRESVALGLGLLGPSAPGAREVLTSILQDRGDSARLRGVAAISLGLSGDPAAAPALLRAARERTATKDPAAAAVAALGLLGEPLVVPDLAEMLEDDSTSDAKALRPLAAFSLGRLGGPDAVKALGRALGDSDAKVRRAAALALGECDPKDVASLAAAIARGAREDRDRPCRNFAMVVCGRIGGTAALDALSRCYALGDRGERNFAALGLGLWVRGSKDADANARVVASLRSDFLNRDDADFRGALAIALGLAGDAKSIPALREVVNDRGDPELRAHCALALGLASAKDASPDLRAALVEKGNPSLQREAALALGLLGDSGAARVLAALLADSGPEHVRASAARALGNLGGSAASDALAKLLADRAASGASRGQAAVGLGLVLDRRRPGALADVGRGLDYLSASPAIREILTIP